MKPLHDLTDPTIAKVHADLEALPEEPTPEWWQESLGNDYLTPERVQDIATVIKTCEMESTVWREEKEKMAARERSLKNRAEWLRGYLEREMPRAAIEKSKGWKSVSVKPLPDKLTVVDPKLIPMQFVRQEEHIVVDTIVDEEAIMSDYLETGEVVDGVRIETDRHSVTIR